MSAIELLYQAALEMSSDRTLIVNAHAHALLTTISQRTGCTELQQYFKPEHTAVANLGLSISADWPANNQTYKLILMLPAKNKQQTLAWMAESMNKLANGGNLLLACANSHGAKSYESALKKLAGNICSRSKSKCRIFSAQHSSSLNNQLATQWIEAGKPRRMDAHGLIACPGLFSWDRADTGSSLLIEQLPELHGTGMDLCCGYGLLSEYILRQSCGIDRLHLIEADKLALDCARKNTQAWSSHIQYHWIDAAHDALPDNLDWIVCNPPFHSGQTRDVALGQSIVTRACRSLKKGGEIYLVANRKLPYEQLLRSELQQCQTLIETSGFKVIKGKRSNA
ncbi:MAG: class I SAM-dependent methyltransferase [Mariprofundus sp.]